MAEIIKYSKDRQWLIAEYDGRYYLFDASGEKLLPVTTPSGRKLETSYINLAERILLDLEKYGTENMAAESVIPWHFTMIDNFIRMEHKQIEQMLDECFIQKYDRTYEFDESELKSVFGEPEERIPAIRTWLSKCTHMQMVAACCIGNAYGSINLAYVLASLLENYSGIMLRKQFKALATIVEEDSFCDDLESILNVFNTFALYYGIHIEENGAIIKQELSLTHESDEAVELTLTEELLIGRNFYHYTNGVRDKTQPFILVTDLVEIEEECEDEEGNDELNEYLPGDCWVKKINSHDEEAEICYIIAIEVEGGSLSSINVVKDEVSCVGGGMFFIPGLALPESHYYEVLDKEEYPNVVNSEVEALKVGRYLPNNFTYIGKRLPQALLEQGGNGGDMTEHTYALQSAYRLAYMHMSVATTEEGIIEDFDYSTYQSSGSAYGDIFSRPQLLDDRHEEIVDMLLYILDLCTEEEYKQIF